MTPKVEQLLREVEQDLPNVRWKSVERKEALTCREGESQQWLIIACSYVIEQAGKKHNGFDATATKIGTSTMVRLTKDLAEKAFKLAESSCPESGQKNPS